MAISSVEFSGIKFLHCFSAVMRVFHLPLQLKLCPRWAFNFQPLPQPLAPTLLLPGGDSSEGPHTNESSSTVLHKWFESTSPWDPPRYHVRGVCQNVLLLRLSNIPSYSISVHCDTAFAAPMCMYHILLSVRTLTRLILHIPCMKRISFKTTFYNVPIVSF